MSRSYKRPYKKCGGFGKLGKRLANKRVRRCKDIPSGKGYKKLYDSWDIADYIVYDDKMKIIRK